MPSEKRSSAPGIRQAPATSSRVEGQSEVNAGNFFGVVIIRLSKHFLRNKEFCAVLAINLATKTGHLDAAISSHRLISRADVEKIMDNVGNMIGGTRRPMHEARLYS